MTFSELGLRSEILEAINDLGFTQPTPIQEQAIPAIISGTTDMVGLAQTGTGKTAAFGLPLLHLIDNRNHSTQGIVVCPTRELCLQITNDLKNYAKHMPGTNIVAVYGGASIQQQEREIKRGAQIIVATPGRMIDLINRKVIKLGDVRYAVLDEADEMLNMGFQEDIDDILSYTPKEKNVWLFSATMPREVAQIAKKYQDNPVEITVGKKNSSGENITHRYFAVKERDRYAALKRIIDFYPEIFGLIFCRTKRETQDIAEKLIKDGYNCESLHGDHSQAMRDTVMKKFREKTIQILCATDVAARGIDVNDITHVINYNLPDDVENYTHRSGRTARAGKTGFSLVLVNTRETGRIRDIERLINKKFEVARVPEGPEICDKQLMSLVEKISAQPVNETEIEPYMKAALEKFEGLTKEDVIKKFISTEFTRFLDYYRGAGDLNADARVQHKDGQREGSRSQGNYEDSSNSDFQRFFLNIGGMAGINKGALLRKICDLGGITSNEVGRIDMKDEFSFFEVKAHVGRQTFDSFKDQEWEGKRLRIELAEKREGGSGYSGGGDRGGYNKRSGGGGGYGGKKSYGGGGGGYSGGGDKKRYGGGDKGGYGAKKSYGSKERSDSSSSSSSGGGFKKKYSSSWD